MKLHFVTLDVFTSTRFEGNPVAIVHVPLPLHGSGTDASKVAATLTPQQKQLLAREFHLSETVFLHEQSQAEREAGDVKIDIFTVVAEVPFAGHPTIGTGNYLLQHLVRQNDLLGDWKDITALVTKAGRMPLQPIKLPGGSAEGVQLRVAHNVHIHENRLESVLGGGSRVQARSYLQCPIVSSVKGMTFILIQLESLDELATVPQANIVGPENAYSSQHLLDPGWQTGILVSYFFVDMGMSSVAEGTATRHIRSRMFGSREDPQTGSAACALTSYLTLTEEGERSRRYRVTQGVEMGRKGDIGVEVTLSENGESVQELVLSGTAVKVMEGDIDIPEV